MTTKRRRGALQTHSFVYLITDDTGHYKIGVAANVERRMRDLQASHHQPLREVGRGETWDRQSAYALEKILHDQYTEFRVSGEWFRLTDEQVANIHSPLHRRRW
jgi:hypothetical protein